MLSLMLLDPTSLMGSTLLLLDPAYYPKLQLLSEVVLVLSVRMFSGLNSMISIVEPKFFVKKVINSHFGSILHAYALLIIKSMAFLLWIFWMMPCLESIFQELLPKPELFSRALYTIDIGQNDLTSSLFPNKSTDQVQAVIPVIMDQFKNIVKVCGYNVFESWLMLYLRTYSCENL